MPNEYYHIAHCRECGSVGTIVSIGKCCSVFRLLTLDAANPTLYAVRPHYSQNFARRKFAARRRSSDS